jgi:hypothetical protein
MDTSTPVVDRFKPTEMTHPHATQLALEVREILKQKRDKEYVRPKLKRWMPEDARPSFVEELASVLVRLSKRIRIYNDHKKGKMVANITSNDNMSLCLWQCDEICRKLLSLGPQYEYHKQEDKRLLKATQTPLSSHQPTDDIVSISSRATDSITTTNTLASQPHALVYEFLCRGMFIANLCFL